MTKPFKKHNRKAARTTPEAVLRIRYRYHQEGISQGQLSREEGLSVVQIGRIVRGEAWQSLPMEGMNEKERQEMAIMAMTIGKTPVSTAELPPLTPAQKQQILESQERLKRYMENTDINVGEDKHKAFNGLEKLNSVLNSLPPAPISVDDFLEEAKK